MSMTSKEALPVKFKPYTRQTIHQAPQWERIPEHLREAVQVISHVLPFRTNQYVLNELIDWDNIPDDPIYRLVFPHPDMLPEHEYKRLRDLVLGSQDEAEIKQEVTRIRMRMNPHPAGQMTHNVPTLDGKPLAGNWQAGIVRNVFMLIAPIELFILWNRNEKGGAMRRLGDDYAKTKVIVVGEEEVAAPAADSPEKAAEAS